MFFLNKAKIMYNIHIYDNLAPTYLHEMFKMRDVNLDNTASNLRSVLLPQAKRKLFNAAFLTPV